jgi:peptide chain release factor subunit 1
MKGILVGGPGMTKNHFLDEGFLNEQLKRKVVAVQDLAYTGSFGLRELVEKSSDVLAKEAITEEKEIMNKFFKLLATEPNKVAYGLSEIERAFELSAVDKLLVSETMDDAIVEKLEDKCDATGSEFIIISIDTPEGEQLKQIGKVAAILRYALS